MASTSSADLFLLEPSFFWIESTSWLFVNAMYKFLLKEKDFSSELLAFAEKLLTNLFFVKKIWMLFWDYFRLLLEKIEQDEG
jgi:hypothetical protein